MKKYFLLIPFFLVSTSLLAGIYHHKFSSLQKPRQSEKEKTKKIGLSRESFVILSEELQIKKKEKPKKEKKDMDFENFLDFDSEEDDIDTTEEKGENDSPVEVKEKKDVSSNLPEKNTNQDEKSWVKQFVKQSSTNSQGDEVLLWVEASNQYPEVRFYVKFIFDNVDFDRTFTITWKPKEIGTSDIRTKIVKIPQYQGSVFDYRFLANHYEDYKQGKLIREGIWTIIISDKNEKVLVSADYKIPLFQEAEKNVE